VRIGIDLYGFYPTYSGGVSTFSLGLVQGILDNMSAGGDLVLLVSRENEIFLTKQFGEKNLRVLRIQTHPLARYINRIIWILSWIGREYRLRYWYEHWLRRRISRQIDSEVDALIVPTTVLNFYDLKVPTILCIHDIQQEYFPENFTIHQHMLRWATYRLSSARASKIQVSSCYIRDCLLEKFTFLSPHSFLVAPEGVDLERFSTEAEYRHPKALAGLEHQGFIFYPAQIWKHKNHLLLMHSLVSFRKRMGFEIPCVLTGSDYGSWSDVERLRIALGLKSVFYLGPVEFPELLWLYKNCAVVLALGLHESSSLPVREGAAFGKPLICADIPPNIEASKYLHINLFQKDNPEALTDLLVLLNNKSNDICRLAAQNVELVRTLRWVVVARLYLEQINYLLNNSITRLKFN